MYHDTFIIICYMSVLSRITAKKTKKKHYEDKKNEKVIILGNEST